MKAISAKVLSCCVLKKVMQCMHGIISYMFDYWANLVVHLLLLKSSMIKSWSTLNIYSNYQSSNPAKVLRFFALKMCLKSEKHCLTITRFIFRTYFCFVRNISVASQMKKYARIIPSLVRDDKICNIGMFSCLSFWCSQTMLVRIDLKSIWPNYADEMQRSEH